MKRFFTLLATLLLLPSFALACDVCTPAGQPKFLAKMTHGLSPQGWLDWVLVGLTSVIVLITLFYAIKFILHPGETNSTHIKRTIIAFENSDY